MLRLERAAEDVFPFPLAEMLNLTRSESVLTLALPVILKVLKEQAGEGKEAEARARRERRRGAAQ